MGPIWALIQNIAIHAKRTGAKNFSQAVSKIPHRNEIHQMELGFPILLMMAKFQFYLLIQCLEIVNELT
mgnify:CR=1 FL=1